jgi:hypothetical protein
MRNKSFDRFGSAGPLGLANDDLGTAPACMLLAVLFAKSIRTYLDE